MPQEKSFAELRRRPRLPLPAMYTLVRVRPVGEERFLWTGHIYDISESGMRFELDEGIEPGTELEVRIMLPGASQAIVEACGKVVRYHDEDEVGPIRMGMNFEQFHDPMDRTHLSDYLQMAFVSRAA